MISKEKKKSSGRSSWFLRGRTPAKSINFYSKSNRQSKGRGMAVGYGFILWITHCLRTSLSVRGTREAFVGVGEKACWCLWVCCLIKPGQIRFADGQRKNVLAVRRCIVTVICQNLHLPWLSARCNSVSLPRNHSVSRLAGSRVVKSPASLVAAKCAIRAGFCCLWDSSGAI